MAKQNEIKNDITAELRTHQQYSRLSSKIPVVKAEQTLHLCADVNTAYI